MALNNGNQIAIEGTDGQATLDSSFIRIIAFNGLDNNPNETTIDVQFAFYSDKNKWIEDWRKNIIKVEGIDKYRLNVKYSRIDDGIDILAFIYTKLIGYLITLFPDWDVSKLVPELQNPNE